MFLRWIKSVAAFLALVSSTLLFANTPSFADAQTLTDYTSLAEPSHTPLKAEAEALLLQHDAQPTPQTLEASVLALIRLGKAEDAWSLVEGFGPVPAKAYFEAKLAAVNANMAQAPKLSKLAWARRLKETCTSRVKAEEADETALECLAKFHQRAPRIAGGDKDAGNEALQRLIAHNPARGYMVRAEIVFSQDPVKARHWVDQALAFPDVYDEGLMQAAMVYGYFKDWEAVSAVLGRVPDGSPVAAMRHYQIGKLSAEMGERLEWGEASLLTFLQGSTHYYGVDFRGPAHWRLGQIFEHGERLDLAKLAFERALEHMPRLSSAKKSLKALNKRMKQGS